MCYLLLYLNFHFFLFEDNEFHNFEHATHVLMSVKKLLGRISDSTKAASACADHSLYFDPLIQFGCALAALVHDIDHQGVSNIQLVKERAALASKYNNKTVAEQNSIDIGWAVFMGNEYAQFRSAVCPSDHELQRLRQVVVNGVIATDIFDAGLREDRNRRWENVFTNSDQASEESHEKGSKRATLILEHLIQASDISHCMQHWHVYRKWNERLFREMHQSYRVGRGDRHPAEFWNKGELDFFDFFVIPLARKLRDCKVFGGSSDEFLNYAEQNRLEWARRGEEIVSQMMNRLQEEA
jgi:3'5'-cyclic nucleotide phosphodiesterase